MLPLAGLEAFRAHTSIAARAWVPVTLFRSAGTLELRSPEGEASIAIALFADPAAPTRLLRDIERLTRGEAPLGAEAAVEPPARDALDDRLDEELRALRDDD